MFQTTTLHTGSGEIEMTTFLTEEGVPDKELPMIWIEFHDIMSDLDPEESICWDNEDYLFEKFYPFLLRWKSRWCFPTDYKDFADVWQYFEDNEELIDELIEMFDVALKQGWYVSKG